MTGCGRFLEPYPLPPAGEPRIMSGLRSMLNATIGRAGASFGPASPRSWRPASGARKTTSGCAREQPDRSLQVESPRLESFALGSAGRPLHHGLSRGDTQYPPDSRFISVVAARERQRVGGALRERAARARTRSCRASHTRRAAARHSTVRLPTVLRPASDVVVA